MRGMVKWNNINGKWKTQKWKSRNNSFFNKWLKTIVQQLFQNFKIVLQKVNPVKGIAIKDISQETPNE